MSKIDVLFVTPQSRLEVYQGLSNEFAAIEGPSGRGSYDGDSAGNKANTKASAVRAALKQARSELASNPINF